MKSILLSLFLTLVAFNSKAQINLVLTGNCSTQGVYATTWADQDFWDGSGGPQTWGTPNMFNPANSVNGDLVIVEGVDSVNVGNCTYDRACSGYGSITNLPDLNGKIAIVHRGLCEFSDKALLVQQAGAIACIIINATDTLIDIDGALAGFNVFIPTIMVSNSTGIAICDAINQGCSQAYIGDPLLLPNYNSVTGSVLFDVNGDNCATSTVSVLDNYPVSTTDGTNIYNSFSTQLDYTTYVNLGTYTTTVLNLPAYLDAVPNQDVTTFTTSGNSHTADFCIVPNQTINDVSIDYFPIWNFSPGFTGKVLLTYQNNGTTTQSGTITLNFDDSRLDYLSSSEPLNSQSLNQLTFNYSNLLPYETRNISITFDVLDPPVNIINDTLNFSGQITPITGDVIPANNSFNTQTIIVGGYDPNDISITEGSQISINDAGEYVHYLVRFQNTGTAPAVNVIVKQILDQNLDWSSLQILDASHPMDITMINDSVDFKFYNINLPDSTSNESESHGYIAYKIKTISTVNLGDQFSAKADIYFDFNQPVTTNTVTTTFSDVLGSVNETNINNHLFKLYPNPTSNVVYIQSNQTIDKVEIFNQLGELILVKANTTQIDLFGLEKGIYFIKVTDVKGNLTVQKLVKK